MDVSDSSSFEPDNNIICRNEDLPISVILQDPDYYKMTENRGLALIFNHENFNPNLRRTTRIGTNADVNNLKQNLNYLGYKDENILVFNDLKLLKLNIEIDDIKSKHKNYLKKSDCILIFILTHGKSGNVLFAYDREYNLCDIINEFAPNNCPELANKPKLFFIQACRGSERDKGVNLVCDSSDDFLDEHFVPSDSTMTFTHPIYADIFIAFSSHFGCVSYRNTDGSFFIQEFCIAIKELENKDLDIHDITRKINFNVSQRNADDNQRASKNLKQISAIYSTLIRKIVFPSKN